MKMLDFGQFDFGQLAEIELAEGKLKWPKSQLAVVEIINWPKSISLHANRALHRLTHASGTLPCKIRGCSSVSWDQRPPTSAAKDPSTNLTPLFDHVDAISPTGPKSCHA